MRYQSLFLLGGHDLEMNAIIQLLEEHHLIYKDRSLQWNNAYLSQYEQDLSLFKDTSSYKIYGIALQEDIVPPSNYVRIDHHNQYTKLPSALEQIAELLHHPLNRWQQLIAINDKAYIPGLQQAGASQEEILRIRFEDRKAQGVSINDELLAEKAIRENKEETENLIVVRAYSDRFSPICDRLYPFKQLLIYTDKELVYYGKGIPLLQKIFKEELLAGKMFCGGGDNGYLGTKQKRYSFIELQTIINQIKQYMS